jgi:hypothetical protein
MYGTRRRRGRNINRLAPLQAAFIFLTYALRCYADYLCSRVSNRSRDSESSHPRQQCSSLQPEFGRGAVRSTDHPTKAFERSNNQSAIGVVQGHRRREGGRAMQTGEGPRLLRPKGSLLRLDKPMVGRGDSSADRRVSLPPDLNLGAGRPKAHRSLHR